MHKNLSSKGEEVSDDRWDFEENERVQKMYKSHRDASVFDGRFIQLVMNESVGVPNNSEEEHSSTSQTTPV